MSVSGREWVLRLSLLGGSLFAGVAVGEIVLRRVLPPESFISWQERDARGLMVHPADTVALHQAHGRQVEYRFNDLRLRGVPVPEEGPRVLLLGDSFVFGWLLSEGTTAPDWLQARADSELGEGAARILNGGVANWGASDYVAFMEVYGDLIRPDMVVVLLNCYDASRSDDGLWSLEGDSLVPRIPPAAIEGPIDRALGALPGYDQVRRHSQLYRAAWLVVNRWGYHARGQDDVPREVAEAGAVRATRLTRKLFRRLHEWTRSREIPLVVLTTGFIDHCYSDEMPRAPVADADLRFLQAADSFFAAEGIPFADLTPAVEAAAGESWDSLRIPSDGHPNERGARLIAAAAWSRLEPQLAAWSSR